MIKLIVPLIIGLLMGLSGGGFYSVVQASKAHAAAVTDARKHGLKPAGDPTHAEGDSTSTSAGDSASHGDAEHVATAVKGDSTPAIVATATPAPATVHAPDAQPADAHARPVVKPTTTPTPVAIAPVPLTNASTGAPTAVETQAHQRRLAKIFATMSAKDAARVLAQMTDHDVSLILGLLADRQAAAILTSLPAPRAAALSQLQPRRGGGEE